MEIKAKLDKPYIDKDYMDFIVEYNHNLGYTIEETSDAILAWGETEEEQNALGYCYDETTKEFINTIPINVDKAASVNQHKTVYMLPKNCTSKKTLECSKYQTNLFINDEWVLEDDYRNCWVVDDTMEPKFIEQLEPLEEGFIVITEEQKQEILQDKDLYVIKKNKLVKNPNYDKIKTKEREESFNKQFLITSLGAYRLVPQGFANAQQSIDFADKMIEKAGSITPQIASNILFYTVPDFSKPEQCTEEWLVSHQIPWPSSNIEDWNKFYLEFGQLYIQKMYKQQ